MALRLPPTFRSTSWLTAGAFVLHVAEEAPGFAAWARRHASPRYSDRRFVRINGLGLAMTIAGTAAVNRSSNRGVYLGYHTVVLTQQALFNPLFHAGTTVAYREYSPGLVTSLGLFWPLWWHATRAAIAEQRLSRSQALATVLLGGVIHAGAVADQVYFVAPRQAATRLSRLIRTGFSSQPRTRMAPQHINPS